MRYIISIFCVSCAFLASFHYTAPLSLAAQNTEIKQMPVKEKALKKTAEKKWRAIYIEGGGYTDYQQILASTAKNLATLGLIAHGDVPISTDTNTTKPMWDWLVMHAGGNKIIFLKDGFYSGDWDEKKRIDNKNQILKRIKEKNDIDLIFAFGTPAGLDMATDEHSIPTFSMSVTDAVLAGIVTSLEDSGRDHVKAQIEVGRYERQLTIFHDVFTFKRLGVPYTDTPEGHASIALDIIEETARKLDFEIVPCFIARYGTADSIFSDLKQCIQILSETSDAVYLATHQGMRWDRMTELLQPLIDKKIPSFSQSGLEETKLGVLMSLAQNSFNNEGIHGAKAIAAVIAGAKPRDLQQGFAGPLGIAINMEMARRIGWKPSFDLLASVNSIYQEIKDAKK